MIPLFSQEEYDNSIVTDKLQCQCEQCNNTFYTTKREISYALRKTKNSARFCSKKCETSLRTKKLTVQCLECNNNFTKKLNQIKISPNHFCSRSCSVTYNNKHKSTGNRRSKLEHYIEEQLTSLYPNLHIDYNKKDAISSELDIYIPSLKLAFELNGIFHYEPIYGSDKLNQIQENDISKSKACFDKQIDLCIIDSSGLKYFKPSNAQKYLDIIVNIINQRTTC